MTSEQLCEESLDNYMDEMEFNEDEDLYFSQFPEDLIDFQFTPTQQNNPLDEVIPNLEEKHHSWMKLLKGFTSAVAYQKRIVDFFKWRSELQLKHF
jgi:hypothetical protein